MKRVPLLAAGSIVGALNHMGANAAKAAPMAKKQMGLQGYSLRYELPKDTKGGLVRLAKLGYTELEMFGYNFRHENNNFGDATQDNPVYISAEDLKKMADDAGLKIISSHVYAPFVGFSKETVTKQEEFFKKAADIHAKIGIKYIVQGGMTDVENMEHVKFMCDMYNRVGEITKAAGVQFGYHNHSGEFRNIPYYAVPVRNDVHVPGRFPHTDVFERYAIEGTDPRLVIFEFDVYWAVVGVQDPLEWFHKYANRIKMMHIKDRWIIGDSGMMNFENIFKKAYEIGIEHFFVEIEANKNTTKTQWDAVEASAKYIQNAPFVK